MTAITSPAYRVVIVTLDSHAAGPARACVRAAGARISRA